jgi:hypothetical protein
MSELGFANPADKKSGPTYSALVGATIVFDFWKIIIRGLPILGWIRLLEPCDISRPASSNDSQPNLQRFAPIITAIRGEYYAKRKKFGLGRSLVSARSEAKAPKKQKQKAREEEAWRREERRGAG